MPTANVARIRLWPLAVIAALAAVALGWIWLVADITRAWAVVFTGQTVLIALLLTLIWLAFLSRLRWRTRLFGLGTIVGPIALLILLLRIDNVSGDLVPSLAWRFGAKPHEKLTHSEANATSPDVSSGGVDLTASTPRDYPQFMGKNRDATLRGVRLARDWEDHPPRLVWRQPIGAGWSSFAVVGDYAVTQEQRGANEMVTCYELTSGKLCWSHADEVYYESKMAGDGPRATPSITGGRVYTIGATGLLNCLKGATGSRLWQRDVLADTSPENAGWGKACSPLVLDDLVVVTGGAQGPTLVAYRLASGELAWKADDRPAAKKSYSSPMVVVLAGVRQIVMLNDDTVCGYDPATGRQLWEHAWEGPEPKVTQPVVVGENHLLVASGYGVGTALFELSRTDGDRLSVREVWSNRNLKPKFTNMVVHEANVYGLDEGILICLDLETGAKRWKKGRYNHGQIMLVGDVILIQAENGHIVLVEATPTAHRELATFPALDGKTWGHPVLVPPYLLVRNDHEAACYELAFE